MSHFFNLRGKSFNIYYWYHINSGAFIDILYHIKEVLASPGLQMSADWRLACRKEGGWMQKGRLGTELEQEPGGGRGRIKLERGRRVQGFLFPQCFLLITARLTSVLKERRVQ